MCTWAAGVGTVCDLVYVHSAYWGRLCIPVVRTALNYSPSGNWPKSIYFRLRKLLRGDMEWVVHINVSCTLKLFLEELSPPASYKGVTHPPLSGALTTPYLQCIRRRYTTAWGRKPCTHLLYHAVNWLLYAVSVLICWDSAYNAPSPVPSWD